jgi:hypothetical protein
VRRHYRINFQQSRASFQHERIIHSTPDLLPVAES